MSELLSHISHLELASPDVEASVAFYEKHFGLREVDRDDNGSVYLRCWGDYYRYSLIISPGEQPALVNMAWRTTSEAALAEAAKRIEAQGDVTGTWHEPRQGHGRSYQFTGPWGHTMELYWEVERFVADDTASIFIDRPERRSSHAAAPRQLDHVTIAATDVKAFCAWYRDALGFRAMGFIELDDVPLTVFGVLTTNEKSHDLGIVLDTSSIPGRANHIAFWTDSHEELVRAADVLMENGTDIEYGPSIHGIGEQVFLYFREPSGFRVELNTGGYRNYVPDWTPNVWRPSNGGTNVYRNGAMPLSMTESFPPDPGHPTATEEGVLEGTEDAVIGTFTKKGNA